MPALIVFIAAVLMYGSTMSSEAEMGETEVRHSSLIRPGSDGRLVCEPDSIGNRLLDYSYAGYAGGGVRLPRVKVRAVVQPGGGNDADRIQRAIDTVSAMAPDSRGIRGAVLIKRGRYELLKPVRITAGGVVLRGEGNGADGTVLVGKGDFKNMAYNDLQGTNLVVFEGASGARDVQETAVRIADEYVPLGARSFRVESGQGFKPGDQVIVRRFGKAEWYQSLKLDMKAFKENIRHDAERTVVAVDGGRITVDIPLPVAIDARWGGGEVVKYDDSGRIEQCGVENLRGESDFDRSKRTNKYGNMDRPDYTGMEYYSDEQHYWNFIAMKNVRDSWVRDIASVHFAKSAVDVGSGSKRVTVRDCESYEPVSVCAGGRRFTFQVSGQMCLVMRCRSDQGRHSFVLGGVATCGPNVFLECTAVRPYGSSEPHSSLVVGSLYDNVKAPLAFRYALSVPPRWMSFNSLMWNCEGMFIVQRTPSAQNYSIGHIGLNAMIYNRGLIDYTWPEGFIESLDEPVEPRSLYLRQLEERLGRDAVRNTLVD